MDQTYIQKYLEETNQLSTDIKQGKKTEEDLLGYICREQEKYAEDNEIQKFFTAEYEFHRGEFENALKHYVQAKVIPLLQFFCYRVSAFIAHKRNHIEQALRLARKAQAIQPNDDATEALLETLLEKLGSGEEMNSQEESREESPIFSECSLQNSFFEASNITPHLLQDESLPMSSPLSNSGVPPSNATLTRRFYGIETEEKFSPLLQPSTQETYMSHTETALQERPTYSTKPLVSHLNSNEHSLETRIQAFQRQRAQSLSQYIKQARQRKQPLDNALFIFNGWTNRPEGIHLATHEENSLAHFLLSNSYHKPTNGFYLKWQGKGIVINPGRNFLDQFHKSGLHVTDIDIVIVTHTDYDSYSDVKEIYELNYQLNKINSELKIIQYYLNHKALLELSHILKPNFKQERNAIHGLELFVDSPDVEKVDLTPEITLNYFPTSTKDFLSHYHGEKTRPQRQTGSPLGIRLDLRTPQSHAERRTLKLGYISGTAWSPLLGHHLGPCDILFAGFGHTQVNDFSKLNYNETCLGYFGTYSLSEEVKPQILLCCEFDGRDGDIRLEVSKKMRHELSNLNDTSQSPQVILPADNGLYLDLKTLHIRCSVSQEMINPAHVRVVKSGEAFSNLLYLSPGCLLE